MGNACVRLVLGGLLLLSACIASEGSSRQAGSVHPVVIDYFFTAGCADCARVREQVLPEIEERFEGLYILRPHDVGVMAHMATLVAYQERLAIDGNEPVCIVVDYRHVLNGFETIKTGLVDRVDQCLAERQEPGWRASEAITTTPGEASDLARGRLERFTLPAVLVAGLIDGLNPCAISMLVFFLSLLAVARVSGRRILVVGVVFGLASFVTYLAIGAGLLRMFHLVVGFRLLRAGVNMAMVSILIVMAALSVRDAIRYRRSGRPESVLLQLPVGIKQRIHAVMRRELRLRALVPAAFVAGCCVTALESVCTGQVYLPTLILVARDNPAGSGRPWSYLLLYNLMFVVPLMVVFVLAFLGLRTRALLEWSKRHVAVTKFLMAGLFLALAAGILCL